MSADHPKLPKGALGLPSSRLYLPAESLRVDHSYQRALNRDHAQAIRRHFDQRLLGSFTVSRRSDGGDFVLNGQHRRWALLDLGYGKRLVPCDVLFGLSLEDERFIFEGMNRQHLPFTVVQTFRARLVRNDPGAETVAAAIARAGLALPEDGRAPRPGEVSALAALEEIDRQARDAVERGRYPRTGHESVLDEVLPALRDGWGNAPGAYKGDYLRMAWRLLRDHRAGGLTPERIAAALRGLAPEQLDELARREARGRITLGGYAAAMEKRLGLRR